MLRTRGPLVHDQCDCQFEHGGESKPATCLPAQRWRWVRSLPLPPPPLPPHSLVTPLKFHCLGYRRKNTLRNSACLSHRQVSRPWVFLQRPLLLGPFQKSVLLWAKSRKTSPAQCQTFGTLPLGSSCDGFVGDMYGHMVFINERPSVSAIKDIKQHRSV